MTIAAELVDAAPLLADLLARVFAHRRDANAAQIEILRLATLWADAHPADRDGGGGGGDQAVPTDQRWDVPQPVPAREVTDADRVALSEFHPSLLGPDGQLVTDCDDVDDFTWVAIPALAWDAPAAFASANRMSTTAGKALIRDALVLRHRLPRTWDEVLTGRVTAWRARRIAQVVLVAPADVVEDIDTRLAPVAGSIGPIALAHLLDAAMLRLHAELHKLEQIETLDQRRVTLDETSMTHTGLADLNIHSDWADLTDLHGTMTRIAHLLSDPDVAARVDPVNALDIAVADLDVRRAIAAGVLADPDLAADLLRLLEHPDQTETGGRRHTNRRSVQLVVHLTDAALYGMDPLVRCERLGPVLANLVGAWCARPDTAIPQRHARNERGAWAGSG